MRERHVRNCFDFFHFQNSKIGLPLLESVQRIMIRAEVFWQTLLANRPLEHPAQRGTVNRAEVNAKSDQATCKLVHHYENPMGSQDCGFASKQVATPQTVLGVTEERKPGWTLRPWIWPVVGAQDPANHIFVYLDSESQRNLLGNVRTTPSGIALFHCNDCVDEISVWSLRARPTTALLMKTTSCTSASVAGHGDAAAWKA